METGNETVTCDNARQEDTAEKDVTEVEEKDKVIANTSRIEKDETREKGTKAKKDRPTKAAVAKKNDSDLLYETQFFGFTPMSFSDGIYNALQLYTWELLEQVQLAIQQEFHDLITMDDAKEASKTIMMKITKSYERAFDKLELYLTTEILKIPKDVVLPEDQIQLQYPEADKTCDELDEDIKELKEKIKEAKITNANLKHELTAITTIQTELDKTLSYIGDLSKIISPDKCETLSFVSIKTLQLKAVLERLDNTSPAKKPKLDGS